MMATQRRFLWKRWLVVFGLLCMVAVAHPFGVALAVAVAPGFHVSGVVAVLVGLVGYVALFFAFGIIVLLYLAALSAFDWLTGKDN